MGNRPDYRQVRFLGEMDVFPVGAGLLDSPGAALQIRMTCPKKEAHYRRAVEDARPYEKREFIGISNLRLSIADGR